MSEMVLVTKSYLDDIANAIGSRLEETPNYTLSQMPSKIASIGLNNIVTVYGAPSQDNSSILEYTKSGGSTQTAYFDSNGTCILQNISSGPYTFINKVYVGTTEIGITARETRTESVVINGNTTITLYPSGALYWYGKRINNIEFIDDWTTGGNDHYRVATSGDWNSNSGTNAKAMINGYNCLYGSVVGHTNYPRSLNWGSATTIDKGNYTRLNMRIATTWVGSSLSDSRKVNWFGLASGKKLLTGDGTDFITGASANNINTYTGTGYVGNDAADIVIDISNTSGPYYIAGYGGYHNSGTSTGLNMQILAIWLS